MTGTIVVGYIPTPEGLAALARAKDEARMHGARLVVVNAGKDGSFATPLFATAQDLEAIDAELSQAGVPHEVLQSTEPSSPAAEILGAAEQHHADLIVIGIRRRSTVGKLFTGSTAQQVLLEASCPVFAVKPSARH